MSDATLEPDVEPIDAVDHAGLGEEVERRLRRADRRRDLLLALPAYAYMILFFVVPLLIVLMYSFATRTRTGEIQSRIFSDIGSMQAVVTNVMTQIVSSGAGILMAVVAMLALDWRLTLFSLIALPFAVWMNRRVGSRRRVIVGTAAAVGRYRRIR